VPLAGDSTHRHALNETISGLVAGNGTGIASELHGASVSGGCLVDVDGVGETGDFGGRVLAEGDGVGEGLVSGGGHQGDTGGGVGDIHGGLGGAHLGSELSGDTDGLQETIVVLVFGEDEFAVHVDWLWLSGGWLGRKI